MLIPQRRELPKGQLLINHQWRDAADGATMPIIDPTTEAVTTEVAKATIDGRCKCRGRSCPPSV